MKIQIIRNTKIAFLIIFALFSFQSLSGASFNVPVIGGAETGIGIGNGGGGDACAAEQAHLDALWDAYDELANRRGDLTYDIKILDGEIEGIIEEIIILIKKLGNETNPKKRYELIYRIQRLQAVRDRLQAERDALQDELDSVNEEVERLFDAILAAQQALDACQSGANEADASSGSADSSGTTSGV